MTLLGIVLSIVVIALFWRLFVALFAVAGGLVIVAIFFLYILVSLGGCAPTDPFVSEYNQAATIENWSRCNDYGYIKIHVDHTLERERLWSMRDDLIKNKCQRQLGSLWVDSLD